MIKEVQVSKELIELFRNCFKVHNIFEKSENDIKEYLREATIYAYFENVVVGAIVVKKKEGYSSLNHLCVSDSHRKKGISKKLVKFALENTHGEVQAKVTDNNLFGFAKEMGFSLKKELPNHYRKGETAYLFVAVLD